MVRERILKYLDFKGISKYKFYKVTGLSNGFLDKSGTIGVDKCEIIYSHYPDLNFEWLITGVGDMIKNKKTFEPIDNITNSQIFDTDVVKRISYIRDTFFDGNNSKFADFVGTSEANIRNYCKSIVPRTEFLIALATKLEINFDWLMLGKGEIRNLSPTSYVNFDSNSKDYDYLTYLIELQKGIIEDQKKQIDKLKNELNKALKK